MRNGLDKPATLCIFAFRLSVVFQTASIDFNRTRAAKACSSVAIRNV